MAATPIPPSVLDLERRRLESTLDQDLASLSLDSLRTTTDTSYLSSASSLEYPRAGPDGDTTIIHPHRIWDNREKQHHAQPPNPPRLKASEPRPAFCAGLGPTGTPRARNPSGLSAVSSLVESPVSTAGHHVSQMTLADGVFRKRGAEDDGDSEFDPERSLGRLVGELGRVMEHRVPPRPTSPFTSALSPPRSPSPLPSLLGHGRDLNLSLTLNRNDPLLSPPQSRKSSSGSEASLPGKPPKRGTQADRGATADSARFSSLARDLGDELKVRRPAQPQARRALSDSTAHNVPADMAMTPGPKKGPPRLAALKEAVRRPASAPAGRGNASGDMTGMTGLLETPAKGDGFGTLGKNEDVGGNDGAAIPATLATLHARLRALETENSLSRRRIRELEGELDRARSEVNVARYEGDKRLKEVIGEKTALEDLVATLRAHLARITVELEQHKALVSELREHAAPTAVPSPPRHGKGVEREVAELRHEVERLGREVQRLGGIVEEGLETRRKARGERTMREESVDLLGDIEEVVADTQEVEKVRQDVAAREERLRQSAAPSKLRQGVHASASVKPTTMPPTVQPPTRVQGPPTPASSDDGYHSRTPTRSASSRQSGKESKLGSGSKGRKVSRTSDRSAKVDGPESPFPSIRAEDEDEFFALSEAVERERAASTKVRAAGQAEATKGMGENRRISPLGRYGGDEVPPQTVLARVLRELEDDFAYYKAIYAELAEQYRLLDAASVVTKRHVLADHLREVIDTLEQKADQIAALYDLLSFQDKPCGDEGRTGRTGGQNTKSVHDVMRMVRESLGEEAMRRLGVGRGAHAVV